MNSSPQRRQGIDGLSRRGGSASPHAPLSHTQPHAHQVAPSPQPPPAVPATPASRQSSEQSRSEWAATLGANAVSHPSLPLGHATLSYRHTNFLKKVLYYPIVQPIDPRVVRLAAIRLVLSLGFWLVVVMPFIFLSAVKLSSVSPSSVVLAVSSVLGQQGYIWLSILTASLVLSWAISRVVGMAASRSIIGIKIRSIDHRRSSAHRFILDSFSSILSNIAHWLLHGIFITCVITLLGFFLLELTRNSGGLSVLFHSWLAGIGVVLFGIVIMLASVRYQLLRAMSAVTDQPMRFVQAKSTKLVFHNLPSSLLVGLISITMRLAIIVIISLITWAEIIYIRTVTTLVGDIMMWLLGVGLIVIVWTALYCWRYIFWASFYHAVATYESKQDVSRLFMPQKQVKPRRWPVMVVACTVILSVTACGGAVYYGRQRIGRSLGHLQMSLPTSVEGVIPKI